MRLKWGIFQIVGFEKTQKKISIRGSHFRTHGGAVDLKIVLSSEEKLFMVRIMGMRSQCVLVGMVLLDEVHNECSQALLPSLCGILVYNDESTSVTTKEFVGKLPMVNSL